MIETVIIVAVIIGLVEAIKRTGFLPSKFSAIVAIVLGVAWYVFFGGDGELGMMVFQGLIAGLTASGLYSGGRATIS